MNKKELALLLEERERRQSYNKLEYTFPDTGKFARDKYPKQLEFFKATASYNQVAMVAANRSGKSYAAAYMMALHLTGKYPDWWEGRKFDYPVNAWAIGVSNTQTKQVLQALICGEYTDLGSGLVPKDCIGKRVNRPGVSEGIETLKVKHYTDGIHDGWSTIGFKAYEMERKEFQGFQVDVAWLDEEPPPGKANIYSEVLTRTATTDGLLYCTFTPLFGLSDVVLAFMPGGRFPENGVTLDADGNPGHKYVINVEWSDSIPHLPKDKQKELLESYAPHERDARAKGIPQLGSGAIYPILEEDICVDSFEIPFNWKRVMGMDVSPNRTAILWGAISPADGALYIYSEYYANKLEHPAMIKDAMESRGSWIPGCIDPASDKLIAPGDGRTFYQYFQHAGIELVMPKKANIGVEAGLYKARTMLESGLIKVFKNLNKFREEYRLYRRDEQGKIVKKNDDLMDAMRYMVMVGLEIAETEEEATDNEYGDNEYTIGSRKLQRGASEITGY